MKYILILLFFVILSFKAALPISAERTKNIPQQTYLKADVVRIVSQGTKTINGIRNFYQVVSVRMLDGTDKGKTLTIESGLQTTLSPSQIVRQGETVILTKVALPNGKVQYQVYDVYRINFLIYLTILFVCAVILIARWKGLGSLIGLSINLIIIFLYIVPHILSGADPLKTSIYGSTAILILTTYIAHGVSKQTTVALFSTFIALILTVWFSSLAVGVTHLTGFNEAASTLQFGPTGIINVRGLLLGGIIIGALGALNDATTTQAATVFELARTDSKLPFTKLFGKGFSIGREHIISMVNTLVLAYAGSSLSLFLFLILNPQKLPFWVILNSEDIGDEIIRTLSGSMGLILVVPIVTLLAALICSQEIRLFIKDLLNAL